MVEKLIFYLFCLDCLIYIIMTLTAYKHNRKTHHFWKGFPLHWSMALLYLILLIWLGFALYRLDVLF